MIITSDVKKIKREIDKNQKNKIERMEIVYVCYSN
jgi:hypothetical protein